MASKKVIGDKGEEEACHYLIANGYHILERNWRFGRAEIDIIGQLEEELVFIEVKTRKNNMFGYPETFLSESQQERIHLAAEHFIKERDWKGRNRFDIISIIMDPQKPELEHFEDAF